MTLSSEKPLVKRLVWAILFAISMGYFEAAVVIDLRQILCPGGALFPLNITSGTTGLIELGREFFSLLMLISVAAILSTKKITGMFWFLILFGVWDIFYYVFLKILIGWPESFFTWDILFLLPVPWVAPVLAPVIISLTLIGLSIHALFIYERADAIKHPARLFAAEGIAVAVMLISFCHNWREIIDGGVPHDFLWSVFVLSEILMVFSYWLFVIRKGEVVSVGK